MIDDEVILECFCVIELIGCYVDVFNYCDWDSYVDCWIENCIFKMMIVNDEGLVLDKMMMIVCLISVCIDGCEGILGLVCNYNIYLWLF